MRLKENIQKRKFSGTFFWYPIANGKGKPLWPGKFPDKRSVEQLRKSIPSDIAWEREYMLRIIADQEQVVHPEWLHYYKELPDDKELRMTVIGIDLAISQKETADFTSMVTAKLYDYGKDMRAYILPNPVNERLTFPNQVERIKLEAKKFSRPHVCIEDVGYQRAIIQQLEKEDLKAEGIKTHGQDKRARLAVGTHLIQSGQVLFPEKGAEKLIEQLTGFGIEKHDDLADAFAITLLKVIDEKKSAPGFIFLDLGGPNRFDPFYGNRRRFSRNQVW